MTADETRTHLREAEGAARLLTALRDEAIQTGQPHAAARFAAWAEDARLQADTLAGELAFHEHMEATDA